MYSSVTHIHAVRNWFRVRHMHSTYSGKLTFQHPGPAHFVLAIIWESRPQSRQSMRSFTGGRLTFLNLGSTSVGLVGGSGLFFKARIVKSLLFSIMVLTSNTEFSACHDKIHP